jgi:membrane-associated phospholipid phosphatase
MINDLIENSAPIIMKIKKHHNRPRPKVLAKKMNIKFDDKELDSMKTPSYPSGHSAQGIMIAEILSDMHPKHAKAFKKIGKDISYSRNVAHAHYKSDSKFGEQLGKDMYKHLKSKKNEN